jgi:cell division protein FtsQ
MGALCRRAGRAALPGAITVAAVAAAGGLLFLGYRWLTASPRFALASVEVRGARELPEAEIERAVAPEIGANLFSLPLDTIERRLRTEPWVADVAVRRRLPDRLVVDIEEREAAAVVDLDGLYLADASGRVFKRADVARGEAVGLPVVTGIGRDAYRRRPDDARARIREALAAAAAYDEGRGRPPLGEVHDDTHRGITLYTRRPVVALRVGHAGAAELRRRLAVFDAAWAALAPTERAAVSAIHLDREGAPVRATVAFADAR